MAQDEASLRQLFMHLCFIDPLPSKGDDNIWQINRAIIDRLIAAIQQMREATLASTAEYQDWVGIERNIDNTKNIYDGTDGWLSKKGLLRAFENLSPDDFLILYIAAQNAALLVHRTSQDLVHFEAFEVTPFNKATLASSHYLIRKFPGNSTSMPYQRFSSPDFSDEIASYLERASMEPIAGFIPKSWKAGAPNAELRDTNNPALVTDILMGIVEAFGARTSTPKIIKHTWDIALWEPGALLPWRRSPFWLVLRVGLQRILYRHYGPIDGYVYYKFLTCVLLVKLLDDVREKLHPTLVVPLIGKIGRRLAKLEQFSASCADSSSNLCGSFFAILGPFFAGAIQYAWGSIRDTYDSFNFHHKRSLRRISGRPPPNECTLELRNSRSFMIKIMESSKIPFQPELTRSNDLVAANRDFEHFSHQYKALADLETQLSRAYLASYEDERWTVQCTDLSTKIAQYITQSSSCYNGDPIQTSYRILTLMDLWVSLDRAATTLHPLLRSFAPGFPPNILEKLQLPLLRDLRRLERVEKYILERNKCCQSNSTIFVDPKRGCFAELFFDSSPFSVELQKLKTNIESQDQQLRKEKADEWEELIARYNEGRQRWNENECTGIQEQVKLKSGKVGPKHIWNKCPKHRAGLQFMFLELAVHEAILPKNISHQKALLVERFMPKSLAVYRDATWQLISHLGRPNNNKRHRVHCLAWNYGRLKNLPQPPVNSVTLGSDTKSFDQTHYRLFKAGKQGLPKFSDVCKPNGMKLRYCTNEEFAIEGNDLNVSFDHLLTVEFSPRSAFALLQHTSELDLHGDGPTSNQIIASQTECPPGLSPFEYKAFLELASGKELRWLEIITALGSKDLNFSTEAVAQLVTRQALQVGPNLFKEVRRICHSIFLDRAFSERLIQQVSERIDSVATNWRETTTVNMLLTITHRVHTLSSDNDNRKCALSLLMKIREITWKWIRVLQGEISSASTMESVQLFQRYACAAALACKQTFAHHLEGDFSFDFQSLQCFLEASMALQDNLPAKPDTWHLPLRQRVVQDIKMVHALRAEICAALSNNMAPVAAAIAGLWPVFADLGMSLSSGPTFQSDSSQDWIQMSTREHDNLYSQKIHLDWANGYLLVDGLPIGNLPAKHRCNEILVELFNEQILRTFPSKMKGMTYKLAVTPSDTQVHIGFRKETLIVQTYKNGIVKELVPRQLFQRTENDFDLPAALLDECTHWLNVKTGTLEVRRKPCIWEARPGDWELNVHQGQARRRNKVSLIDPAKQTFRDVVKIFEHFEEPKHITIWKPDRGALELRLERLDLSFSLRTGEIVCRELQAKIDSDQQAGTWYGLESKLILRKIANPRQRIILVPLGDVEYRRSGQHMAVRISPNGLYGTYTINNELGRLDSPPELRLIYLKALIHAYTSTAIRDPLTGRTGTEEALHCLRSGYCFPYMPLAVEELRLLEKLASLTPKRYWYPADMKVLESVDWNPRLLECMQHEDFLGAVENIRDRSRRLMPFYSTSGQPNCQESTTDFHLGRRALHRRQRYDCSGFSESSVSDPIGLENFDDEMFRYTARDTLATQSSRGSLLELLCTLILWPSRVSYDVELAKLLNGATSIRGFRRYEKPCSAQSVKNCHTIDSDEPRSDFSVVTSFDHLLSADIVTEFGPLVRKLVQCHAKDKVHLVFFFALLAYQKESVLPLLKVLVQIALSTELKNISLPSPPSFSNFVHWDNPTVKNIATIFTKHGVVYASETTKTLPAKMSLRQRQAERKLQDEHNLGIREDSINLATKILSYWPSCNVSEMKLPKTSVIDLPSALNELRPVLQSFEDNIQLSKFVDEVDGLLRGLHDLSQTINLPKQDLVPSAYVERSRGRVVPTLSRMMTKAVKTPSEDFPWNLKHVEKSQPIHRPVQLPQKETQVLRGIAESVRVIGSHIRTQYADSLLRSVQALTQQDEVQHGAIEMGNLDFVKSAIDAGQIFVEECRSLVVSSLQADDDGLKWLEKAGILPRMSPTNLLEQLRSSRQLQFGNGMKEALVQYGVSITFLQRLLRIEDALLRYKDQTHRDEINNQGHENWLPLQYPDWLLLEIDANFLLRNNQVEVAKETITPTSSSNSLLQLQMGQGKSLCIVPAVCTVLADKKSLLRIIVPRSLLTQTAQVMRLRLSGLVGRQMLHVPFSRRTLTTADIIGEYHKLHVETLESGGITLTIPEHIMSFKLSSQQKLSDGETEEASRMVKVQNWLQAHSRDILDESDHSLSPKIQLIYPGGAQMSVDGSPQRWETAQVLLRLCDSHMADLASDYPQSVNVVRRPNGGFPLVYFTRRDAEDRLIDLLVKDIESGFIPSLPLTQVIESDREAVIDFIRSSSVTKSNMARVEVIFKDNQAALHVVYLLRGLLTHRILLMTLKKRFNVHYGMHFVRKGLAVPFQYKGVPSEAAEWGHPDVAILFTCLSFYYGGLTEAQLKDSIQLVAKCDDPSSEFELWISRAKCLPSALKDWNTINIDDQVQMSEIYNHINCSMPAVDYYLNGFVFPMYAKQFSTKLQTSAWDIPLFSSASNTSLKTSKTLTTGFSGTADGKYLFPLNIRQQDLQNLVHTDAEVLSFLLLDRNRRYRVAKDRLGNHISEYSFLKVLNANNIRVLIDAGAQIMESSNESLVVDWLRVDTVAKAAVYFNNENKLMVINRKRKRVPLTASPFAENLGDCVVYFAQANCRGSDVSLPADSHAALTLSLGQTKDATVQAAMRLRQLGTTQRLTWFATPEVDQSIRDHQAAQGLRGFIDSATVISWLLEQTCDSIESLTPLFYSQGKDFCSRLQAENDHPLFLTSETQTKAYLKVLRKPERQSLLQLYAPRGQKSAQGAIPDLDDNLSTFMAELTLCRSNFDNRAGSAVQSAALEEVEVEREYAHEVEQIREAQKATHFKPLIFRGLHQDLQNFVQTGRLPYDTEAVELAFRVLGKTGPGKKYGIDTSVTSSKLFVSTEFCRTVVIPDGQSGDNFLRQPKYLVWGTVSGVAVLVSPEEAECLLGLIRSVSEPKIHVIMYAAPVTRRMLTFNDLRFVSIPPLPESWEAPLWLKTELGLFAGKLFFGWEEYGALGKLLGLEDVKGGRSDLKAISRRPITLIQELLDLRRKGQDFYNTPMGYVAQGKRLSADHSFFEYREKSNVQDVPGDMEIKRSIGGEHEGILYDSDGDDDDDSDLSDEYDDEHCEEVVPISTISKDEPGDTYNVVVVE